jgi:hypothetical protein
MTLETWTAFFGWMTVLNFGFLLFAAAALFIFKPMVLSIHQKLTGLDEPDLNRAYFSYLSHYKVMALIFSLVPYLALRLI